MNVDNIRVFLAVNDTGSVSEAASGLGLTQSGASAALNRLRALWADELFVRTARGMQPTAYASSIVPHARQIVSAADKIAGSPPSFDPQTCRDEFCIVTGDILESAALLGLSHAFEAEAPHARLRSMLVVEDQLEEALARGKVDAVIGSFSKLGSNNVLQTTVAQFGFACFCSASHPFASQHVTESEFSGARYVLMESSCCLINVVEDWLRAKGIARNVMVRTSHFYAIIQLIQHSNLIAILPCDMGQQGVWSPNIMQMNLSFSLPCPDLNIYWHRIFHDDPRNMWFRRKTAHSLRHMSATFNRAFESGEFKILSHAVV